MTLTLVFEMWPFVANFALTWNSKSRFSASIFLYDMPKPNNEKINVNVNVSN